MTDARPVRLTREAMREAMARAYCIGAYLHADDDAADGTSVWQAVERESRGWFNRILDRLPIDTPTCKQSLQVALSNPGQGEG